MESWTIKCMNVIAKISNGNLECSICLDSFKNEKPCYRLDISDNYQYEFYIGSFYLSVERYLNTEAWYWVLKHEENIISHNNVCEYEKLNYVPPAILWTKVMVGMEELIDPSWITLLIYEYKKQLNLEEHMDELSDMFEKNL